MLNYIKKKLIFLYPILIFYRRIFQKRTKISLHKNIEVKYFGKFYQSTYGGYYDINNFSDCNNYLIFHQKNLFKKKIKIIKFSFINNKSYVVGDSNAFSSQLGTRLQWFKSPDIIAYNDLIKKKLCTILLDINKNTVIRIPYPFYSFSNNKNYFLTLNFKLLEKYRPGYGYNEFNSSDNKENYIGLYDLNKRKIEIKTVKDILKKIKIKYHKDYYFNHLSWSLDNKSFLVYLIFPSPRKVKLIYFSNINNPKTIDLIELISHHCWIDAKTIIFYGKVKGLKGIYTYNFKTEKIINIDMKKFENKDFHISKIGINKFICDFYPNKFSEQELSLLNIKEKNFDKILNIFSNPFFSKKNKCDLHAKISNNNKMIAVDISKNYYRQLAVLFFK